MVILQISDSGSTGLKFYFIPGFFTLSLSFVIFIAFFYHRILYYQTGTMLMDIISTFLTAFACRNGIIRADDAGSCVYYAALNVIYDALSLSMVKQ